MQEDKFNKLNEVGFCLLKDARGEIEHLLVNKFLVVVLPPEDLKINIVFIMQKSPWFEALLGPSC